MRRLIFNRDWETEVSHIGGDRYTVPWHPYRVRWIKLRNLVGAGLRFLGVRVENRNRIATRIMDVFAVFSPRPTILYDRRRITVIRRPSQSQLLADAAKRRLRIDKSDTEC